MDIQRNLLTFSLIAISTILYFKWIDYSAVDQTGAAPTEVQESSVPDVGQATETISDQSSNVPTFDGVAAKQTNIEKPSTLITVTTDVMIATINTKGGIIERLELRKHLAELSDPDQGFVLLKREPGETFVVEDGITSKGGDAPNHGSQYQYTNTDYSLDDQNSVIVPLTWVSETGIKFVKTYTFTRDNYVVDINYDVSNTTSLPWSAKLYGQFNRTEPEDTGGGFGRLPSYTGAVIYEPEDKYQKISFSEIHDRKKAEIKRKHQTDKTPKDSVLADSGWVAMMQHYFLGAWIPPTEGTKKFYTKVNNNANPNYRAGFVGDFFQVDANSTTSVGTRVYLGPKEQSRLKGYEKEGIEGINLTVDYTFLTFIANPLFVVLSWIHDVVGNWGWAIILLTILIKLAFYPLSAASYRSMGKMKKLQPRMATLKERYKDDRQKFQTEMMAMYKKEKVNPAGGCLPILIQIPVFIALYWVLLESVEMRHAPFALWWVDLSAKDPYYVLPVLMGVSMYLMQKLSPTPLTDDIQKKVMMIMPFALTFLFMTFPQGLVLYWVVNNILTMAQQWFNYRQQEKNS